MPSPSGIRAAEQPDTSRGSAHTARLIAAIDTLAPNPGTPRPDSGKSPEEGLNPYHLAGRLLGLALSVAEASGSERFPGAFAHTALASGVEWARKTPASRLGLVAFLGGSLYDLALGFGRSDLVHAANITMHSAELAVLETQDQQDEETRARVRDLRERIHSAAVLVGLFTERSVAQPDAASES